MDHEENQPKIILIATWSGITDKPKHVIRMMWSAINEFLQIKIIYFSKLLSCSGFPHHAMNSISQQMMTFLDIVMTT